MVTQCGRSLAPPCVAMRPSYLTRCLQFFVILKVASVFLGNEELQLRNDVAPLQSQSQSLKDNNIHINYVHTSSNATTESKRMQFVHVFSPYAVDYVNPFYPLDQIQNVTFESMIRAWHAASPNLGVRMYCAVFPSDSHIVPDRLFETAYLNRSTFLEYPNLLPPKALPFVDDIIRSASTAAGEYDYLIFTNADIGLTEDFYNAVAMKIYQGYDAFTINRRTLPKSCVDKVPPGHELSAIDEKIQTGLSHPGSDCFVIKREIVESFSLGDLFLGFPPVAKNIVQILTRLAFKFHRFDSSEGLTFHLGDDRSWQKGKHQKLKEDDKQLIDQCAFMNRPYPKRFSDHWVQNAKNCGNLTASGSNKSLPGHVKPNASERYFLVLNERLKYKNYTTTERCQECILLLDDYRRL
jgi:hypothetical protein